MLKRGVEIWRIILELMYYPRRVLTYLLSGYSFCSAPGVLLESFLEPRKVLLLGSIIASECMETPISLPVKTYFLFDLELKQMFPAPSHLLCSPVKGETLAPEVKLTSRRIRCSLLNRGFCSSLSLNTSSLKSSGLTLENTWRSLYQRSP